MDNVKRVYRLYREEGLSLRLKRPRRNNATKLRQPKQLAQAVNEIWSMDFVVDALFDGRKLRMLTVVDLFTRECLAIDVGQSLKGDDVGITVDSTDRRNPELCDRF
jgi:putative transposase